MDLKVKLRVMISYGIFLLALLLNSCQQPEKLKVVITRFPNDSINELMYLDLPITSDSIGIKEVYFEDGKLHARGSYKNGKREGNWICYRRDGRIEWRSDYTNGMENGLTECYLEDGSWRKMITVNNCRQGATIECNMYSKDKMEWVFGQYKNCLEEGEWIWRNKNGHILAKQFYSAGKFDKYYENFYNNGGVFKKAFLRNGYIDSLETFDSIGKLLTSEYYHDTIFEPPLK
ncbi:MAG: hypothetical protein JWO06_1998 [Bacteroidota bacterium]|nr:hypothetical protein [Bacteroidota bacterium]